MINGLKVAEWREVVGFTISRFGAYEPDRPRNNARYQKLVVGHHRSAFCIRVDLDMLFVQARARAVDTLAILPVRIW